MDPALVSEIFCLGMFATACVFLLTGFPVAFTLAGTALIFAFVGFLFGVFDLGFLTAFPQRIFTVMINEVLVAVPLFIFMGVMLERSRVAEELLENMGRLFGPLRGGLGYSVCVVGALLAASTGIVGATVVTMGLLSLPTMLRRGYDPRLACGSIAASGTLGQIIPPSIVLVLLGDQLSVAFQTAQFEQGLFSPDTVSVNDLFAGALFPGLVLVAMYIGYQIIVAVIRPKASPAIPLEEGVDPPTPFRLGKGVWLIYGAAVAAGLFGAWAGLLGYGLVVMLAFALAALIGAYGLDPTRRLAFAVGLLGVLGFLVEAGLYKGELSPSYLLYLLAICYGIFATPWRDPFWRHILHSLVPPVVLIIAVLGSILGGLASPTEAAGVGAAGALMLAGYRLDEGRALSIIVAGICLVLLLALTIFFDLRMQRDFITDAEWAAIFAALVLSAGLAWGFLVAIVRVFSFRFSGGNRVLVDVMRSTMEISSMVFVILVGAAMFSLVFRGFGGDELVESFLHNLPGGTATAVLLVMAVMFFLGFFLDFLEIVFIVVPIVAPILLQMEVAPDVLMNPVWLGVMMAVNLQTSFLTPPFGFALFYLRGVAPDSVSTMDIYRGIIPFVVMQLIALAVLWFLPELATWLPLLLYGR